MKNKSENALRTIGELAEILEVPAHVIRFWETKFNQIKPIKYNNRRYYDQKTIDLFKHIKGLLYVENYSISEAIDFLKKQKTFKNSKQPSVFEENPIKLTSKNEANYLYLAQVKDRLIRAKNKLDGLLQ